MTEVVTVAEIHHKDFALDIVALFAGQVDNYEERLAESVSYARDAGCTWKQIANRLGITRQAAEKRYAKLVSGE